METPKPLLYWPERKARTSGSEDCGTDDERTYLCCDGAVATARGWGDYRRLPLTDRLLPIRRSTIPIEVRGERNRSVLEERRAGY